MLTSTANWIDCMTLLHSSYYNAFGTWANNTKLNTLHTKTFGVFISSIKWKWTRESFQYFWLYFSMALYLEYTDDVLQKPLSQKQQGGHLPNSNVLQLVWLRKMKMWQFNYWNSIKLGAGGWHETQQALFRCSYPFGPHIDLSFQKYWIRLCRDTLDLPTWPEGIPVCKTTSQTLAVAWNELLILLKRNVQFQEVTIDAICFLALIHCYRYIWKGFVMWQIHLLFQSEYYSVLK